MTYRRHANATTTTEMREFIRVSELSVAELSKLFNVSETTIRKWRSRDSVEDGSHKPHHIKTKLSRVQEYVVVELRKELRFSLDDLLAVTHRFINPEVSRATLARCLKRNGVSKLSGIDDSASDDMPSELAHMKIREIETQKTVVPEVSKQALKSVIESSRKSHDTHSDGLIDVVDVRSNKLPRFSDEQTEKGLFVASDPETGWVYVDIYGDDAADAAERYMSHTLRHAPFHIRRILAGNYHDFINRYSLVDDENSEDRPLSSNE